MNIGEFVKQPQDYKAFIPASFPPREDIDLPSESEKLHAYATLQLGKLDGITQLLPDLDFFIFMYVRKEAALSSEIEGTRATIVDSLDAEVETTRDLPKDVERILHYIEAMNYGLNQLNEFPLSLRLIRKVHKTLLEGTGDAPGKMPGEFRASQNWLGGTSPQNARYVPPPVDEMHRALDDLEKFLHKRDSIPPLVKTGLAHAQFETIHPFLDGNGRTGRLLVTFYLCQQGILEKPVLYLSEYFMRHREAYFDGIEAYHNKGDLVPWLNFFLEGVATVAERAIETARNIEKLRERDVAKVQSLGRRAEVADKVLKQLYKLPIVNVRTVQEWTGQSRQSANNLVNTLVEAGILEQRDREETYARTFWYKRYLDLFTKE
jgi:Fic family protein